MRQDLSFFYFMEPEKSTSAIIDALAFAATAHPIFKNDTIDIVTSKTKEPTNSNISLIIKTALKHSISIAKKSVNMEPNQQLAIHAEIAAINAAIVYLNHVNSQRMQDSITRLSEIDALRRYSKGKTI